MRLVMELGNKYQEISGPASDAFADDLRDACSNEDFSELILDLNGTRMISSMAMGTIFATSQKLREKGKTLHIVNACDKIVNLLRMVNMTDLLQTNYI